MRSIARLRAAVMIQAPGFRGLPSRGQRSSAVANASWTASSASSRSPMARVRMPTAFPHSSRKTCSTVGCTPNLRDRNPPTQIPVARKSPERSPLAAAASVISNQPFLAEDRTNLDGAALRARNLGTEPDSVVEVRYIGDEEPADDLLRLREWTVGHHPFAVSNADDLRGRPTLELVSLEVRIDARELSHGSFPARHLLRSELQRLVFWERFPARGVVVDEERVLHAASLPASSTCRARTSTAPCSAPGIFAAQSSASSRDAHSSR